MSTATSVMITVEDYRLLPETGPRYQLIEGGLYMSPAPNRYHQDISVNLEFILIKYLEAHPIGKVYDAPFDVYLTEHNVYQPDIIFVARENYSILTDAGAEGAPDFVVEILSPSTAKLDRSPKRRVYARCGVKELWFIDPESKTIEVYDLQQNAACPMGVYQQTDTFSSPHFPGLTFHAADIFKR